MRNYSTVRVGDDESGKVHVWDDSRARILCRESTMAPIWGCHDSIITCKNCAAAADKLGVVDYRARKKRSLKG